MSTIATIGTIDFALGTIASLGLIYLLYSETMVVHYRRFFRLITFGLLLYAGTGPLIGTFAPAYIHAVHGTAALFIVLGLYDLVRGDLHREVDLSVLLDEDPGEDFGFMDETERE